MLQQDINQNKLLVGTTTLFNINESVRFIYVLKHRNLSEFGLYENYSNYSTNYKRKILNDFMESGGQIDFVKVENELFKNNLVLIDSKMPELLANLVLLFYKSDFKTTLELTNELKRLNPLNYNLEFSHFFYQSKIQRFLLELALGMNTLNVWTGKYNETTLPMLKIEDNKLLNYQINTHNIFEEFLFNNTQLLDLENDMETKMLFNSDRSEMFIHLNLQIGVI